MKPRYGVLQVPKPGSQPDQCEDAFAYSDASSLAVVCDGASTAFEARCWARLLARGFIEHPPLGDSDEELLDWLDAVSTQWSQSIQWQTLNIYEELKADSGSAATLIGLQLTPSPQQEATGTWRCLAMGDSCLFQVRDGQLVVAVPIRDSSDFSVHTPLFSTKRDSNLKSIGRRVTEEGTWAEGDIFFLVTDAVAQWFLRVYEQGGTPWDDLTALDESRFRSFVHDVQTRRLMRQDDATALMVGLGVSLKTRETPVPAPRARPPELVPAEASLPRGDDGSQSPRPPASEHPATPSPRPQRRRIALIASAVLVLATALALAVHALVGGSPAQRTSAVPPARDFARLLTTYSGEKAGAYRAYESALQKRVANLNQDLVAWLAGTDHAPPNSFRSRPQKVSVVVKQSSGSQAELYAVVEQAIRTATNESSRTLLIDLTMVRQGLEWLVSNAQIRDVSPGSGALVPPGGAS
ncbi:protein phosphatase 2C domain-containing protein [Streptomyces sp. NPDC055239]